MALMSCPECDKEISGTVSPRPQTHDTCIIRMRIFLILLLTVLLTLSGCGQKNVTDERMTIYVMGAKYSGYYGSYTGEVIKGNVPNGAGVFSVLGTSGDKWTYDGEWNDGVFCGGGVFTWEDGSYFVGEFADGDNADGSYYSAGGYEYDAVIKNGVKVLTPLELGTDLFEQIYVPYANRELPSDFYDVKAHISKYAEDNECTLEITDATSRAIGTIQVNDSNSGDYVFIAYSFTGETNEQHISIVSYYQSSSKSEVSMSNLSGSGVRFHDTYNTHVIGNREEQVKDIATQREFLFYDS